MIAILELKEFITSFKDPSLMTTEQQQYTSNSTSKCLEWTGGVLLEIKQLLYALNPSLYEHHGPDNS